VLESGEKNSKIRKSNNKKIKTKQTNKTNQC